LEICVNLLLFLHHGGLCLKSTRRHDCCGLPYSWRNY
jgi:hypothetical protein